VLIGRKKKKRLHRSRQLNSENIGTIWLRFGWKERFDRKSRTIFREGKEIMLELLEGENSVGRSQRDY